MHLPKLQRLPELDALRGLFLVWMTLTHLPTRFSDLVNEPFGFISSADGFVFLSALLIGRLYIRKSMQDPTGVRNHMWKRSLRLYAYHLFLLAFAFTVAAGWGVHAHRVAITNLLNFYLHHPGPAIVGSVLLIYCPPLFDILPMYVLFLFLTPLLLSAGIRFGWKVLLACSTLIWLLAQIGLRDLVHNWVVHVTHLQIPLLETGAFNLFAWQAMWVVGLWLGSRSAHDTIPLARVPRWGIALSGAVCAFFIAVRFAWFGPHLTEKSLGLLLDKWQIGPLRALNIAAFLVVFYWLRKPVRIVVAREPFLTLGKASLQVFCAHLFFVFAGLALLYGDMEQLHGVTAVALLVVTFACLFLVAVNEVRKNRARKKGTPGGTSAQSHAPPVAANLHNHAVDGDSLGNETSQVMREVA
jgi:hypothetical protein